MISALALNLILGWAAYQDSLGVGNFIIHGNLINEASGIPVNAVTVALYKDGLSVGQTRTDDTGKFQFRGLTKGRYEVVANLERHPPVRELVAMNTQNQVYHVSLYARSVTDPKDGQRAASSTVDLAYLRLPRKAQQEFERALRSSNEGNYDRSVRSLRTVLELEPNFSPAHNQLGINLYLLGRRQEAAQAFLKATQLDTCYSHAFVNLGKLLNESGDHLGAIEFLRAGVACDFKSALGFFQLGIAYYQLNSLQVAESYLKKALELDSDHTHPIRLELANLYLKRGEKPSAAAQLTAFLQENPDAPQATQVRKTLQQLTIDD
jgi:tetratricopeptide (TPR) repeat protein